MKNLIDYKEFLLNESSSRYKRYYYKEPEGAIEKIRQRLDNLTFRDDEVFGGDPEDSLKRLVIGGLKGIFGVAQSISDKFGEASLKGKNLLGLKKKKEEALEKWGERLERSGKNKAEDFETFYKDAIIRGKRSFGKNFDIRNPRTDEERIYVDYIEDAIKYYRA